MLWNGNNGFSVAIATNVASYFANLYVDGADLRSIAADVSAVFATSSTIDTTGVDFF